MLNNAKSALRETKDDIKIAIKMIKEQSEEYQNGMILHLYFHDLGLSGQNFSIKLEYRILYANHKTCSYF